MRIAIVLDSLIRGGAERQALYATGELTNLGYDVELIYYNRVDAAYDASALRPDTVSFMPKKGRPFRFLWQLQAYFRSKRFDVVHGWMGGPSIYAGIAGRVAGVPVVFAGYRCEYDGTGATKTAHRVVNKLVTGWIVNSKATVPSLVRGVGANPSMVRVVYNGIDPKAFTSGLTAVEAKAKLGIPENAGTVSIIGQLRPQKNHSLFIQTAALVAKQLPATEFLVVGHGTGDEQQVFERLAESLGVGKQVRFLGSRSDIPDVLAATDIIMLTSHYEGVSNSLLEAMSVGRPVVSTAYAGVNELITDGHDGLIAPMGDAGALASHVISLLLDAKLRERLGEAARETIRSRFTMSAMARNLYAVYQEAFDRSRQ